MAPQTPTPSERPLTGQHAVITGGGRGIGAAIALELARLGADLTLLGRTPATLERLSHVLGRDYSIRVSHAVADVTDQSAIDQALATAAETLGPPHMLVNNAGAAESAPFKRTDTDLWRRMIDVNLTGVYHCTHAALPFMLAAGYGRIVNVASTAGHTGYAYVTAYCAAKHGVIGLTRALALETAREGITVNAVCPGYTETEMTAETIRNIAEKTGRSDESTRAELTKTNPQGRLVRPEEVARAVGWLVLPGAAAVTGQSIVVAGGEVMP